MAVELSWKFNVKFAKRFYKNDHEEVLKEIRKTFDRGCAEVKEKVGQDMIGTKLTISFVQIQIAKKSVPTFSQKKRCRLASCRNDRVACCTALLGTVASWCTADRRSLEGTGR